MALAPGIATVAANLLSISAARESSNSYSRPPEFAHQFRQAPARAGTAAVLRDL
jgi:hypothetical protein